MSLPASLDFTTLRSGYLAGAFTVEQILREAHRRASAPDHPHVWISLFPLGEILARARALPPAPTPELPLHGLPFAIKDNIDLGGVPTTAACPDFAYTPSASATLVQRLLAAGAIPLGKTNLDQFATGLVGVRSPCGAPSCAFHTDYISGGSSSGSAVAVAAGLVSFALGTDTAGSGRVPAAFNNLVGFKPTRGLWSCTGLVPACRSLDCPTVFTLSCHDAEVVRATAEGFDPADPYSRPARPERPAFAKPIRFGVLAPAQREFFGDTAAARLYAEAIARLASLGGTPVEFDYAPFREAARLLYAGPWVAERRWAVGKFFETNAQSIHPVVREIMAGAEQFDAVAAFDGQYRLAAYAQQTRGIWDRVDLLLLPTTGTTYTKEAVLADPVRLNSNLGHYTNFVNLLDLSALAIPAGFRPSGLPFGVTLIAPAFADRPLLQLGAEMHQALGGPVGATSMQIENQPLPPAMGAAGEPLVPSNQPANDMDNPADLLPIVPPGGILLAVVGAHLRGQPLNGQLTSRRGQFITETRTAPHYRLFALPNTTPPKPGLVRAPGFTGPGLTVEVWQMDAAAFGDFVAEVPAPMTIGTLELADGTTVKGFACEPCALEGAEDITRHGGWRAYLQARAASAGSV